MTECYVQTNLLYKLKSIIMKSLYLFVIGLCVASTSVFAQIPNAGFESWSTVGSYEDPANWTTLNASTAPLGVFTAEKGTPGSPGASYLKLTSRTVGTAVVNGMATCGNINLTSGQITPGFAYTGQPVSFDGKWQHMIYGSSQGSVSAMLTRWDATNHTRVTVAIANKILTGMAMSWANFSIPFIYTDFNAPDSCFIVLKASGSMPTNQDYLWVDNLSFTGSVAGLTPLTNATMRIFPNPSTDFIQIQADVNAQSSYSIDVWNLQGACVQHVSGTSYDGKLQEQIDIRLLPKGTYLLQLNHEDQMVVHPIVVQ